MHEAFRRLNYAFLTLVRKGDAEAGHSEILIITALAGFQFKSLIDDRYLGKRSSEEVRVVGPLLGDQRDLVWIIMAEDEVPGEVRHQTDVAGHTEFHSDAQLTEHSDVVIINRIRGEEFLLVGDVRAGIGGHISRK